MEVARGRPRRAGNKTVPQAQGRRKAAARSASGASALAPLRFKIANDLSLRTVIEQHPGDQRAERDRRDAVSGENEIGVRAQTHPSASADLKIRKVRARRRNSSFRIAAKYSARNSAKNPTAEIRSGWSIAGSIADLPSVMELR